MGVTSGVSVSCFLREPRAMPPPPPHNPHAQGPPEEVWRAPCRALGQHMVEEEAAGVPADSTPLIRRTSGKRQRC